MIYVNRNVVLYEICLSDVNPLLKLRDLEQAEHIMQDTTNSYLMCVSEIRGKQSKDLTVGLVVCMDRCF